MGQRWSPKNNYFMYVGTNLQGAAVVWLEVKSPDETLVFRPSADEDLEADVEGIVETMVEAFKIDVQHLVARQTKDSQSVHESADA